MDRYERLKAWQLCHTLALEVYRATTSFPMEERFGLVAQTRRAAYSAAANIVEGSTRQGSAEFRRFVSISLGSLAEISYALRLARDLGLLSAEDWKTLDQRRCYAGAVTWKLYKSLDGRRKTK